jgi:hypothetical protein
MLLSGQILLKMIRIYLLIDSIVYIRAFYIDIWIKLNRR